MSKTLKNSNLTQHPATRALVAVSLSISLAAFGCTTDRTVGNGSPVTAPGVRNTPTSGTSTGTESAPTPPPSMTSSSSYVGAQALPTVQRRGARVSAAEAAALLAQQQPRVRYLGPAYPGGTQSSGAASGYASDRQVTGQFQNPALRTNPQITVNSTISSQPTAAVLSGAGGDAGGAGGGFAAGAFVGGSTANGGGFTADSVAGGTGLGIGGNTLGTNGAAPIFTNAPAGFSPVAATGLPIGTLATTATPTTAPTAFTSIAPSPLVSTSPTIAQNTAATQSALANGSAAANAAAGANIGSFGNVTTGTTGLTLGGNTTGTTANGTTNGTVNGTTVNSTSGTTANATANTTRGTATGRLANPVRVTRDVNGRAIITNTTNRR